MQDVLRELDEHGIGCSNRDAFTAEDRVFTEGPRPDPIVRGVTCTNNDLLSFFTVVSFRDSDQRREFRQVISGDIGSERAYFMGDDAWGVYTRERPDARRLARALDVTIETVQQ